MNTALRTLLIALLVAPAAPGLSLAQSATPSAADILQAADRFRLFAQNMQVETRVTTSTPDGSDAKERLYTVFVQADRKSLVLMRSPAEKGQRVLMLGDDFWLVMPGSARPMRITPMQKLLGEASVGDIATMNWSGDYSAERVGDEDCGQRACIHLTLTAARKGVSYQRIELWVGKTRHEPIKADLYVQSEKLAKQARFIMDPPSAPTQLQEMVLIDQLAGHKETRVRYLDRKERTVPAAWLNPMFLATNPNLD
jgi:hypothetical protein